MADDQAALLAQIAALSGAISKHKATSTATPHSSIPTHSHPPSGYPHNYNSTSSYRGASTFRGGTRGARGSSRGAPRGAGAYNYNSRGGSHNRSLVITPKAQPQATTSSDTLADKTSSATGSSGSGSNESWVKSRGHNMSLMSSDTYQKTEPARQAAIARTAQMKAAAASASRGGRGGSRGPKASKASSSSSLRRGENMGEVVIDGVVFVFDKAGDKLVKKPTQPSSEASISNLSSESLSTSKPTLETGSTSTPLRTTIGGENFVRTKGGNLVKADVAAQWKANRELRKKRERMEELKKEKMERLSNMGKQVGERQKARYAASTATKTRRGNMSLNTAAKGKLCPYYTKTGQCKRRLSCPYKHDTEKVAICPGSLRPTGCTRAEGTCMLSHQSSLQNTPHCVHFLRFGSCRSGENCLYSKGHVAGIPSDAIICRDFNQLGWCSKGKECKERHTWECKDFNESGKCEKKGCRLLHVEKARGKGGMGKPIPRENGSDMEFQGDGASSLMIGKEIQIQDGDLFMRDDAAEQEEDQDTSLEDEDSDSKEDEEEQEQEEGEGSSSLKRKRKRGLLESGAFSDVGNDDGVGLTFISRKKRAQEFIGQDDFVGFDDIGEDEEEDDGDEEELEVGSDEESIASEAEESDEKE